jgi:hypothetical protein
MTTRKLDYVLYVNARRWLDSVGIIVDDDDKPMLSKEAIIDTTGREMPIVIHGVRPGPLAKSQMLAPPVVLQKPGKKKLASQAIIETKNEPPAGGHRVIFAIAPEANPFSKKEDIEKVTWNLPMDGSAEIILASAIVAPQLAGTPGLRNITHDMLGYNPLNHSSAPMRDASGKPMIKVIRDPDEISREVLWDTIMPNLASMAKIRTSVDPYTFWLDAHPGDVIRYMSNAEDTCVQSDYRHVTK